MRKKYIIYFIIIIAVIMVPLIYLINKNLKDKNYFNEELNSSIENDVIELKKDLGITGKTEIYTIKEEYDGRKILAINSNIQYKVVMAGILNKEKPDLNNIDNLLQKEPKKNGIWISENSRKKIKNIIESLTECKYIIDEEGYLKQEHENAMNKYDEKLKKIITCNKLYSIDVCEKCYLMDEVTGEIVEELYEEMDPYTPYEYFEDDNKSIFVISTNGKGKLNYNEVIKEIIENIEI